MNSAALSRLAPWVLLLGLAAAPAAARADGWAATFSGDSLKPYFKDQPSAMVVAAGPAGQADEAAAALSAGLRAAGLSLVMDDSALGDVASLDDPAIVEKAAKFPVKVILVARVFPGGGAPTAVVVAYQPDGSVLHALSAQAGTPIPPPQAQGEPADAVEAAKQPEGIGQGVNAAAAASVREVSGKGDASHKERVEEYKNKYLHFGETVYVHAQTGQVAGTSSQPFQGQYRKSISWREFFAAVERPDLYAAYRRRTGTKVALIALGAAGEGAGLALALSGIQPACTPYDSGDCGNKVGRIVAGSILGVTGMISMMTGISSSRLPIKMDEARRLADEHNKKLRARLGLNDDLSPGTPSETSGRVGGSQRARFSFDLDVAASMRAGGVQLRLRF